MSNRTVNVPDISCEHCVKTIEREIGDLAGVAAVSADFEAKRVTIEWDDAAVNWDAIRAAMHEINYPPEE